MSAAMQLNTDDIQVKIDALQKRRTEAEIAEFQRKNAEQQHLQAIAEVDAQIAKLRDQQAQAAWTEAKEFNSTLVNQNADAAGKLRTALNAAKKALFEVLEAPVRDVTKTYEAQQHHASSAVVKITQHTISKTPGANSGQVAGVQLDFFREWDNSAGNALGIGALLVGWIGEGKDNTDIQLRRAIAYAIVGDELNFVPDVDVAALNQSEIQARRRR